MQPFAGGQTKEKMNGDISEIQTCGGGGEGKKNAVYCDKTKHNMKQDSSKHWTRPQQPNQKR